MLGRELYVSHSNCSSSKGRKREREGEREEDREQLLVKGGWRDSNYTTN